MRCLSGLLFFLTRNSQLTDLSPAAQAVLTAATQKLYCLDPEDVPMSASEYGSAIAAALRAAAEKIEDLYCDSDVDSSDGVVFALRQLVLIADELEAQ
jgi:hypothetical protein